MNRRHFLRGVGGVVVALPILETFLSKKARAQDAYAPFAVFIREANGFAQATDGEPERFFPSAMGQITTASLLSEPDRAVSALADYADRMTILRGIDYVGDGQGCGHSAGGNMCLTAARLSTSAEFQVEDSMPTGESIDNRIAREIHPGTEPLTLMSGQASGYLQEVLSYTENKIGGSDANQRRPAELRPFNVYQDLFGLSNLEPAALEALKKQRKSVNDLVRGEMQALMSRTDLSKDDQTRLKTHFEAIRDLETSMSCSLDPEAIAAMEAVVEETGNPDGDVVIAITHMHMDVLALALACGSVRVATLQIGHGNDHTEYWIDGVRRDPFHFISHRLQGDGDEGAVIENADYLHGEIDRIHCQMVKYFCDKLAQYDLGGGSLLDSGAVVFLNDLSNKNHGRNDCPHVIIGSANGFLRTGQYIDAGGVSNSKLLNTIGSAVGVKNANGDYLDDFGDPSYDKGLIDEMLA